jgi:hypothetical protein
VKNEKF